MRQLFLTFIFVVVSMGCWRAGLPEEYRESQNEVSEFTVELTDPALSITYFTRLQGGKVICPKVYYYQPRRVLFKFRPVEESAKTFQTIGRDLDNKYRALHLPIGPKIAAYLFLVQTSVSKEDKKDGNSDTETKYEMGDWQLFEIPAKDVSKDKPIVFPAYEELAKRELCQEKQQLLKDLVRKYEKIEAATKKRMDIPVKDRSIDSDSEADEEKD